MENYGEYLRIIREGKQISISKLAKLTNISKSQISRFERGESDISFSKMLILLNSLNVSLEEFSSLFLVDELKQEMLKIKEMANHRDILQLKTEIAQHDIFRKSEHPLNSIFIKAILNLLDKDITPTKDELNFLTDYLFKIDFWTYYETIMLGNAIRMINLNTSFLLTKELLKKSSKIHSNSPYSQKLIIQLTINCAINCIDHNELSKAHFLLNSIENNIDNTAFFFEKTIFLYTRGYLELKTKKDEGISKMNNALTVLRILDQKATYKNYNEHFTGLKL